MLRQRTMQDVHVALAVAEDDGVTHVLGAQQMAQRLALVLLVHHGQRLDHQGGGRCRRAHGHFLGIHQEGIGQAADFRRHGGREEQGLADLGQHPDDALDIGDEAHVEHAVGFVDDQRS